MARVLRPRRSAPERDFRRLHHGGIRRTGMRAAARRPPVARRTRCSSDPGLAALAGRTAVSAAQHRRHRAVARRRVGTDRRDPARHGRGAERAAAPRVSRASARRRAAEPRRPASERGAGRPRRRPRRVVHRRRLPLPRAVLSRIAGLGLLQRAGGRGGRRPVCARLARPAAPDPRGGRGHRRHHVAGAAAPGGQWRTLPVHRRVTALSRTGAREVPGASGPGHGDLRCHR